MSATYTTPATYTAQYIFHSINGNKVSAFDIDYITSNGREFVFVGDICKVTVTEEDATITWVITKGRRNVLAEGTATSTTQAIADIKTAVNEIAAGSLFLDAPATMSGTITW